MTEINLLFWVALLTLAIILTRLYSRFRREEARTERLLRSADLQVDRYSGESAVQAVAARLEKREDRDRGIHFYSIPQSAPIHETQAVLFYQLPRLAVSSGNDQQRVLQECRHDCA